MIWLASFLLTLGTLDRTPEVLDLAGFAAIAVTVLLLLGIATRRSATAIRLERNRVLLPAASGALTLLVPLGYLAMLRGGSPEGAGTWLVFLTFTVAATLYTQDAVRALLRNATPEPARAAAVTAIVLAAEVLILDALAWIHLGALAVVAAPPAFAIAARLPTANLPRPRRIRRLGFLQSADVLATVAVLAIAFHL